MSLIETGCADDFNAKIAFAVLCARVRLRAACVRVRRAPERQGAPMTPKRQYLLDLTVVFVSFQRLQALKPLFL